MRNIAGVFQTAKHGHFTDLEVAIAIPMLLLIALKEIRDGSGIALVGVVPVVELLRVRVFLFTA